MAQAVSREPGVLDLGAQAHSIADIEPELAQLRRRAGAAAGEGVVPPARAAVLNVVVHATRRVHAERAAVTLAELGARHPSRAIILLQSEGPETEEVRLTCHQRANGAGQVCYEQIVVRTRRPSEHQLRSIVIPLLIPDLPIFLWWTGTPPIGSFLFRQLTALADRLVVDSADFPRPEETLPGLRTALGSDETTALTDLNWTRLTPWRELLAQFFDVPEWRPFLDAVSAMRIGFAVDMDGRKIHPSQALLLLGWMAARLGWRAEERLAPSEAGGSLFRMGRHDGAPVWIRLRPRFVGGADEGNVTGVRVLADRDGHHAEFVIKGDEAGGPHADTQVTIDGEMVARRRIFLSMPEVIELLAEELSIIRSDVIYEDALATLCALT